MCNAHRNVGAHYVQQNIVYGRGFTNDTGKVKLSICFYFI